MINMTGMIEMLKGNRELYEYKGKLYDSLDGATKKYCRKVRAPGEESKWFDAVGYVPVKIYVNPEDDGDIRLSREWSDVYYRELKDFKKKFKKTSAKEFLKAKNKGTSETN